ncbi:MAG: arsenate reductase [Pseudomonadota bacterium]
MITVYGLKNCDTCRKTIKLLKGRGAAHVFHDLRADGLAAEQLDVWIAAVGWEALLNRRGTTWRQLDPAEQTDLDQAKARALMLAHPALIKRPVVVHRGGVLVGFTPQLEETIAAAG